MTGPKGEIGPDGKTGPQGHDGITGPTGIGKQVVLDHVVEVLQGRMVIKEARGQLVELVQRVNTKWRN